VARHGRYPVQPMVGCHARTVVGQRRLALDPHPFAWKAASPIGRLHIVIYRQGARRLHAASPLSALLGLKS